MLPGPLAQSGSVTVTVQTCVVVLLLRQCTSTTSTVVELLSELVQVATSTVQRVWGRNKLRSY